ncbi:MAG: MBL fold metallo-hydrolase [Fimbriimonadia bacterium]|nr:MBL fold metallo-hydrolase [Fimbriimonadia bacterium]
MTRFRLALWLLLGVALLLAGCETSAPANASKPPGALEVVFLDVGQGDCAFIQFPNGKTMLIDGGSPEAGALVTAFLRRRGVSRLDWVVMSHLHADHIGGLIEVLRVFEVGEFWDSGYVEGSPIYETLLRTVQRRKITYRLVEAGMRFRLSEACDMRVLAPRKPFMSDSGSNANNNSIALYLTYQRASFLFLGDLEEAGRMRALSGEANLPVSVLKVGHHGSSNGTDDALLRLTRPRAAVISCGAENPYGHPHSDTLELLEKNRVKVYRTDEHGTIRCLVSGDQLLIEKER